MRALHLLRRPTVVALSVVVLTASAADATVRVGTAPRVPAAPAASAAAVARGFVVIANAANPATTLSKADVMRIFLKKMRVWPGGGPPAEPVDQRDLSPARKEFLSAVLGKDAAGMNAYWQSQLFVGRTTPPPVKASDADVIAFVAATRGGIGYVSAGETLPATVKAITLGD